MLVEPGKRVSLKDVDPGDTGHWKKGKAEEALERQVGDLAQLQGLLYADAGHALLIILQGMDTSGKDGTIRHVMSGMSPLGVQVKPFKAPTAEELAHDFLWRVHQAVPRKGYVGIFNRSHYEDVLVVRVHDLVPKKVWEARYDQINQFEKMLVENNVVVLKFFLHISRKEQRKRLEDRIQDPTKYWKFSPDDVKERRYWDDYQAAYEDALSRCSTPWAPWHVVPADHKWYRNLLVAQTVVEALQGLDLNYPEPAVDLSKIKIE